MTEEKNEPQIQREGEKTRSDKIILAKRPVRGDIVSVQNRVFLPFSDNRQISTDKRSSPARTFTSDRREGTFSGRIARVYSLRPLNSLFLYPRVWLRRSTLRAPWIFSRWGRRSRSLGRKPG